ncbi:putative aldehyde dehydrogenase family [Trypanosoma grayi]|uniref:putative aldehyde dehydrogenase family n=1 Tax=Trypanosoma grayi TaxID=71804 RepID=UPI0004F48F55|nr:putative aldehyde dehydrogenase family [Trypanosoma grayi]KEG14078.1 putative aldehyde dehydrogenase family [Trypanosoma grayi]
MEISTVVSKCRDAFRAGATRSLEQRRDLLRAVVRMLDENESALCSAVQADLRKHPHETTSTELSVSRAEAYHFLHHLGTYMASEKPQLEGPFYFEDCEIRREPLGVVLIIGAWNYPLQLTLLPLLGALAAGNTAVVKPSEMAPATATILQELLSKYLPTGVVGVVNGGVPETTRLLKERFDHIFYTGGAHVAKIVMAAAANHLTPVTLELGGKSPAIVDASCEKDLSAVARRIMWGKVVNAGQTCVAPDYVLVHSQLVSKLIVALEEARKDMLGKDPLRQRQEYPAIVSAKHFQRLVSLMKGGTVVLGGEMDEASRTIAPAVLCNVQLDHPLMTEEIFGPLLPLVPYDTLEEVISFINARKKPLALYVFSKDKGFISDVLGSTSSGGALVNDVIMHAAACGLPFGGVGPSGMGAYHGKFSIDTFSHRKAVMRRRLGMESLDAPRYPPYTDAKLRVMRSVLEPAGESAPVWRRLWLFPALWRCAMVSYHYLRYLAAPQCEEVPHKDASPSQPPRQSVHQD